ncbi:MAG: HAMP domain-containing protein [Oscillospiraceae bacterium]|nr:HAMP domain-containing protein [Oscillospiraceae bacterium]MBQ3879346.1 HAMP domain-containing protein [Oscillospiraceae bacterium]
MFRSLHMKLVLILVLLILAVMIVVGTLLDNRVSSYFLDDFRSQMEEVFTQRFLSELNQACSQEEAPVQLREMVAAYSGLLGIDANRDFCILSASSGAYLTGSDDALGEKLEITPNIITALSGGVGSRLSSMNDYMDFAVPVTDGEASYIIYIYDDKSDTSELTWMLFSIVVQVVLFSMLFAVLLSFLLSKTMTTPIENITRGAARLASGDFDSYIEVHSDDEIGVLTQTFNNMGRQIRDTMQSVEEERNKLNTLFLHMTDGVASFDSQGNVLSMNPAAEQMLGVEYDETLTFSKLLPGVEKPDGSQEVTAVDYTSADRAFQIFFAFLSTTDEADGLMAVIHDVTEQYRLEQVRREFIANVSHELRTPLTSIKSYTETLLDTPDLPAEMSEKFLGVINNEADRMVRIVKDLLTLSRLDYGRLEINYSRFPVDKLMGGVYDAMLFEARNHNHELLLELDDPLPSIEGDRERIEQVVVNIVSNSIKYTPNGGQIVMTASNIENGVRISVQDNGIGIPKEDLPRLFERFYRVDKARSRERGGTGLGLAIAQEIVKLHGGTIEVESEFGKGTKMTVTLPLKAPRVSPVQDHA